MYIKLAIQNMKKSIRNYVIYFVTITLTAAMMYSFLALGFSKEVLTMSENISMLTSGIVLYTTSLWKEWTPFHDIKEQCMCQKELQKRKT